MKHQRDSFYEFSWFSRKNFGLEPELYSSSSSGFSPSEVLVWGSSWFWSGTSCPPLQAIRKIAEINKTSWGTIFFIRASLSLENRNASCSVGFNIFCYWGCIVWRGLSFKAINDLWLLLIGCRTVHALAYIVRIAALHIAVLFRLPEVILLE